MHASISAIFIATSYYVHQNELMIRIKRDIVRKIEQRFKQWNQDFV